MAAGRGQLDLLRGDIRGMRVSLPFMGRDGEAEPSPGGERQSVDDPCVRLHSPTRTATRSSLPTSGEGERFFPTAMNHRKPDPCPS